MIAIRRRIRSFTSMSWSERRPYYARRLRSAFRRLWRTPIILAYYPIGLILARRNIRVIGSRPATRVGPPRIGHQAWELHFYAKAHKLGLWGDERPLVLASDGMVANTSLRDYWDEHIPQITNPITTFFMRPFGWMTQTSRNLYPLDVSIPREDGSPVTALPAYDHVQERYEDEIGSQPLMEIRPEHREQGRATMQELGMPPDAWFVALHVREAGFIKRNEIDQPRDGDIFDYQGAIRLITSLGGWVVRLGRPSMTPLPPMKNVIDYALSDARSPETDIYLMAECRFFLGTNSGPFEVPPLFGRPCAIAASIPMDQGSHYRDDVYLPHLYWSDDHDRYLSFPEIHNSDVRDFLSVAEFGRKNLKVVRPTPENITKLTQEMLDRSDGSAQYDDLDRSLQEHWHKLVFTDPTPLTRGVLSSVNRDYLRANQGLFNDPTAGD